MEGQAVDPLNLVLVQKQSVQSSEASEGVLVNAPQAVSMQEQVAQVVEVHKCVILQELQMILLREKQSIKIKDSGFLRCKKKKKKKEGHQM